MSGQVYGLALLYGMILDAHTDRGGARALVWSQAQTLSWNGTQERDMISDSSSLSAADLRSFYEIYEIISTFDLLQICLSSVEKKAILIMWMSMLQPQIHWKQQRKASRCPTLIAASKLIK